MMRTERRGAARQCARAGCGTAAQRSSRRRHLRLPRGRPAAGSSTAAVHCVLHAARLPAPTAAGQCCCMYLHRKPRNRPGGAGGGVGVRLGSDPLGYAEGRIEHSARRPPSNSAERRRRRARGWGRLENGDGDRRLVGVLVRQPCPKRKTTKPAPQLPGPVAVVSPVLVQMWPGRAQSWCRCGRGEPSPGAGVAGASGFRTSTSERLRVPSRARRRRGKASQRIRMHHASGFRGWPADRKGAKGLLRVP